MAKWITFVLAAVGLAAGIYTVATAKQELPKPPPSRPPSVNPFPQGVAAIGTVEPASRLIGVVAPDQGMVSEVFVKVNDRVETGQPLFQIDPRPFRAQRVEAEAARQVALAEVHRLEASPRAEDLPPAEARVALARVDLADASDALTRTQTAVGGGSASDHEVARREFAVQAAQARLQTAEAELAKIKAGAWTEDLMVARGHLASADARLSSVNILLDRLTVRAPTSGTVIKRNVEPGEFAMATPLQMTQAAMVIGDLTTMHVRAKVDEEDAPLVRDGARAVARVRGAGLGGSSDIPLTMLRIEPLALPKVTILGTPTERVDTRVIEVLFRVTTPEPVENRGENRGENRLAIYSGQTVDVFIEVPHATDAPPQSANPERR